MSDSEHPAITVYLSARIFDRAKTITRKRRAKRGRGWRNEHSGGMRHCWSIKLQRWTPEEVLQIITDTFTRLAEEEARCTKAKQKDPHSSSDQPA